MNSTVALYIRNKAGYSKAPKKPIDLGVDQGQFYIGWYEGTHKRLKAVGRFADVARVAKNNMEAELKNAAILKPRKAEPTTDATKTAPTGHNLADCADKYLIETKNGKAHSTWCSYEITLRKFQASCSVATLEEITREHINAWKDEMISTGAELSSIKNRFRWLKTFLTHYKVAWPMDKKDRITPTEKELRLTTRRSCKLSSTRPTKKKLTCSNSSSILVSESRKRPTPHGGMSISITIWSRFLKSVTPTSNSHQRARR
jgi:hypothetical protein